jgi:RNA polymerase sigma factor (sigma-70 family)
VQGQPTVFLVDDDDTVRNALALLLRTAGYATESYASARAFLDAYSAERPGCLVLDLTMPEINGLELQQALTAKGIDIPIIFLSGHGDIASSVQAIKAGAVDFLQKPVASEVLLARVVEALAEDAQHREQARKRADFLARLKRLTPREREILRLVMNGLTSKDIARQLTISHRTVEVHRLRIMQKLGAKTLPELIAVATSYGL